MRYRTIVADPPWPYSGFATAPGNPKSGPHPIKAQPMQYDAMTLAEITDVPVASLADSDAALWLWTTNRYLPDAFGLIESWGFRYRQTFVWHKTGNPSPFGGTAAPNHAEFLLLAVHGAPKFERLKSSVVVSPKPYEHSRKPEVFLDLIEVASPQPRLELFARRNRLGWDTWGNESLEHVEVMPL